MDSSYLLGIVMFVGLAGCASSAADAQRGELGFSGTAYRGEPSLHVAEARVLDARLNPMTPTSISAEGASGLPSQLPRAKDLSRR